MKLNTTVALLAMAFAAGTASAAPVVGQWTEDAPGMGGTFFSDPVIGTTAYVAHGDTKTDGASVDDVYNFSISSTSDLLTIAYEWEAPEESLPDASFTLFHGPYVAGGTAGMVGTNMSFGGITATTTYSNLKTGNYYFEVTGTAAANAGSDYNLIVSAGTPANPLPAIPEPGNMALLLAGIGLMGIVAKRRARQ